MAGTLKTTFFNLVKYAANDITSWLTDFNGNMDKIDAAMNQNKTAAQTAQDGVDNLESEYESVVQTLATHTTQIDNNEKAIAANATSIEELGNEFNSISIYDIALFNERTAVVTKVENLMQYFNIKGRRVGDNFEGAFNVRLNAGNMHLYDRQVMIEGFSVTTYCTDIIRITGNPFNLVANKWELLTGVGFSTNQFSSNDFCIGYVSESGYTVVGRYSASAAQINIPANTLYLLN